MVWERFRICCASPGTHPVKESVPVFHMGGVVSLFLLRWNEEPSLVPPTLIWA